MAQSSSTSAAPPRRHRRRRALTWLLIVIIGIALLALVVGLITPWPSAMLIRSLFDRNGDALAAQMARHAPPELPSERLGIEYGAPGDSETTLDVFTNATPGQTLPTVVWVHGGAWISGSSAHVAPYLRILASHGYTTVGLKYTRGPEGQYPLAVNQLNDALAYLDEHADGLGIDRGQIVIAGDSAGAQLASQLTLLITNGRYAELVGIEPAIDASQLRGTLLHCGVYDLPAMSRLQGLVAWGFKVALWSYTGTQNWPASDEGATMSTIDFVTEDFPPTFISGGNGDGLTWLQSIPMATALRGQDVAVTELFWPASHQPALGHEYQFELDSAEAQQALAAGLQFLSEVTARPEG